MKEKVLCTNLIIWFQRIFVVTLKLSKRTIGMGRKSLLTTVLKLPSNCRAVLERV